MGDSGHLSLGKCECATYVGRVRSTTAGKRTSSWIEKSSKNTQELHPIASLK